MRSAVHPPSPEGTPSPTVGTPSGFTTTAREQRTQTTHTRHTKVNRTQATSRPTRVSWDECKCGENVLKMPKMPKELNQKPHHVSVFVSHNQRRKVGRKV
jgi:hypothetical protein